jgi:hypothetical protein
MPSIIERRAQTFGLTMINADAHLAVHVTKADIKNAKPNAPNNCAIARAVQREHPEVNAVFVFRSTAWVENDGKIVRYKLPTSLQKEIVAFDRAKAFEPGEYRLSPAPNAKRNRAQKAGKHPQREDKKRAKARRKAGLPRKAHHTTNCRTTEYD